MRLLRLERLERRVLGKCRFSREVEVAEVK